MVRSIPVILSLALALIPTSLPACQLCGTPDEESCCVHGFMDVLADESEDHLDAFRTQGNGWTTTASGTSGLGQPAELTWSIVPNGTAMPRGLGEPSSPSNLISFLDTIHHGGASPGGSDLTQRDWFSLFDSSFERWDALSGIDFAYEPNDDGVSLSSANRGILGQRGDHRLSGHSIDGQISPTFLAYNYFPNHADMVIDTDEVNRWSDPEGNFIRFRNMIMHEVGHGLGLNHLESSNADFLMEPFLATQFDGPQLDDILGIHRLYGDVNESGAGNDDYFNATSLGRFWPGQSNRVGLDATDTVVEFTDVDFLSIDDDSDVDFFRFTLLAPAFVDFDLTPVGPSYLEGPQGGLQNLLNTATMSDLSLTLWDRDGTSMLDFANDNGLGGEEQLQSVFLGQPGDYYLSVAGAQNAAQFYELGIDVELPIPTNPFDFSSIVRDFFRRAGFGQFSGNPVLNIFAVPEPTSGMMMAVCLSICAIRRRRAAA